MRSAWAVRVGYGDQSHCQGSALGITGTGGAGPSSLPTARIGYGNHSQLGNYCSFLRIGDLELYIFKIASG